MVTGLAWGHGCKRPIDTPQIAGISVASPIIQLRVFNLWYRLPVSYRFLHNMPIKKRLPPKSDGHLLGPASVTTNSLRANPHTRCVNFFFAVAMADGVL